ncbi:hypothetical protein ABPG74_017497 [Tetrahymena malaccensis]
MAIHQARSLRLQSIVFFLLLIIHYIQLLLYKIIIYTYIYNQNNILVQSIYISYINQAFSYQLYNILIFFQLSLYQLILSFRKFMNQVIQIKNKHFLLPFLSFLITYKNLLAVRENLFENQHLHINILQYLKCTQIFTLQKLIYILIFHFLICKQNQSEMMTSINTPMILF